MGEGRAAVVVQRREDARQRHVAGIAGGVEVATSRREIAKGARAVGARVAKDVVVVDDDGIGPDSTVDLIAM